MLSKKVIKILCSNAYRDVVTCELIQILFGGVVIMQPCNSFPIKGLVIITAVKHSRSLLKHHHYQHYHNFIIIILRQVPRLTSEAIFWDSSRLWNLTSSSSPKSAVAISDLGHPLHWDGMARLLLIATWALTHTVTQRFKFIIIIITITIIISNITIIINNIHGSWAVPHTMTQRLSLLLLASTNGWIMDG